MLLNTLKNTDGIINLGKVIPKKLYRCGAVDSISGKALKELGVTCVLKLNEEFPLEHEQQHFENILYCPYSFILYPDVKKTTLVCKKLHEELESGSVVAVHCTAGKDRTGIIISAYGMLYLNWDLKTAFQEFLKYGQFSQDQKENAWKFFFQIQIDKTPI